MIRNLTPKTRTTTILGPQAAGKNDSFNCTEVDMKGYESCRAILSLDAFVGATIVSLTAKNSDTTATYGAGTIDNVTLVPPIGVGAADQGKILILEIHRPKRRYLRFIVARSNGGTSAVINCVIAELFNPINAPVAQATADIAGGGGALGALVLNNPAPSLV